MKKACSDNSKRRLPKDTMRFPNLSLALICGTTILRGTSAFWLTEADGVNENGDKPGFGERLAVIGFKEFLNRVGSTVGTPQPQWFRELNGGFMPTYNENQDPELITFTDATPEADLPDGVVKEPIIRQGTVVPGEFRYMFTGGGVQERDRVQGVYRGIPITMQRDVKGIATPTGALIRGLVYKDVMRVLADRLDGPAFDANGDEVMGDNGALVTVADRLSEHIAALPDGDKEALLGRLSQVQRRSLATTTKRAEAIAVGRGNSAVRNAVRTTVNTVGQVWTIDSDALRATGLGSLTDKAAEKFVEHAKISSSWTRLTQALWRVPTAATAERPVIFTCTNVGKRSLVRRADNCIPSEIQVTNEDSMGEEDRGPMHSLSMQAHLARLIRTVTKNEKIFRNDDGSTPPEDPENPGEMDPDTLYEGATNQDKAWELVMDAFEEALAGEPVELDQRLIAKTIRYMKKDVNRRIQAMKARPDSKLVIGMFRDNKIQAESRKNSVESISTKFMHTFGIDYREYKDVDEPNSPEDNPYLGDVLDQTGFGDDMAMMFDGDNYGDANDIGSIHEASVLDGVAEVTNGLVKPVAKLPNIEGGEEAEFDPSRAVEGTNEYAAAYGVMADIVKDIVKNPNTPKWKLISLRATLARNAKSLEMRNKVMAAKEARGEAITEKEADEYNAIGEFHDKVSGVLFTKDIDSMVSTPADKEMISKMSEYSPDPQRVVPSPPRVVAKAKAGKPGFVRQGLTKVLESGRRPFGRVNSKQGTGKGAARG